MKRRQAEDTSGKSIKKFKREEDAKQQVVQVEQDVESEEQALMEAMGLTTSFGSSKGHKRGTAESMSGARIKSKRKYRVYMNKKGLPRDRNPEETPN
jgi:hypothetical protein